jgi:hypothetical protein
VIQVQDATDCAIELVEPHACPIGYQRRQVRDTVDRTTDAPASAAGAALETGPSNSVCVTDITQQTRSNAIACARAGGTSSDGRTYYKGSGPPDYHCERQGEWVMSTNHRYPKGVYNSLRACAAMYAEIGCFTRDGYYDRGCMAQADLRSGDLLSLSFTARYRKFICTNNGYGGYVRCAYDWVR